MTRSTDQTGSIPGIVGIPTALLSDDHRLGGSRRGDLLVGRLAYGPQGIIGFAEEAVDGPVDRILLPRLTEVHVHLDKCHTVDRCSDVGGDLAAAGAAQSRDKARWTAEDLHQRAGRGLMELIAAGCGAIRTHVDWFTGPNAEPAPLSWEVMGDLAETAKDQGIILQRAALTGIDEMADFATARSVARIMARDNGVLGAFVLDHTDRRDGISNLFRLADDLGLPLDFHVDEGLDPDLDGLELIADIALETRFSGPVLCGHACSLASRSPLDVARIGDKLARAGVSVAALPTTNLYLQGRRQGTPDRRGLTRLHELAACGVNIVIGTDNVRDAYCPIGQHDPRYALSLAVMAGHLDPPFGRHLTTITTGARAALGLPALTVDRAPLSELLLTDAASLSELLSGATRPLPLIDYLDVVDD